MALILGATAFSAGCGDDGDAGSGGGTTASSTSGTTGTTGTTGTGGDGGEGGAGEGGSGEGGAGEGGAGEGGSGAACVPCSAPLLLGADPDDLCASSKEMYEAVTACLCEACGAAEGDACYDSCDPTTDVEPNEACTLCGQTAAAVGGACETEGGACLADRGE
ncbi:hypothetical protein WME75_33835 [Sorangium sp. So ce1014]|uniref:hypothetical protein n=1 Tax=Sorangium sp. So ce1014 TaxID=3133326 RepID=UPI003F60C219